MSAVILTTIPIAAEFTANLAQAGGLGTTYTLATVTGTVLIDKISFYVVTAGATFSAVTFQTNQTTPFVFLNSLEGAVANIVAQKNLATAWIQNIPVTLKTGTLIQYTLTGTTGTGSISVIISYRPIAGGYIA